MNSPFQNKFMAKSPLRSHGGKLKKLDKKIAKADSYDAQGSKDYDYLADLQRQRKHLVESHNDPSTTRTEEEDTQVKEDEDAARASAIEMKSPLHGYVDASDMVDPNPSTAHMWNKVFDSMTTASLAITDAKTKKAKKAKQTADLKRIDKPDKDGNIYTREQYEIDYPDASIKCPGTQEYNSTTGKCE